MDRTGFSQSPAGPIASATPSATQGDLGATALRRRLPRQGSLEHQDAGVAPRFGRVYAALDLGTNNCRLLIARQPLQSADPSAFRIIDSFCRIVRLGEGVAKTGRLAEPAIARTIAALKICRDRMHARHVTRSRLIATEACRAAENSDEFLARVANETGLELEVVDRETEALLATAGCAGLADPRAEGIVLFDIGGGSSEIVWLRRNLPKIGASARSDEEALRDRVRAWASMKVGVVTLAEKFGGRVVTPAAFEAMVAYVGQHLEPFFAEVGGDPRCGNFHLLGTSGTVTTIAGVYLGLERYDRRKVDGLWMTQDAVSATIAGLRQMTFEDRVQNGCIGPDRADLVLAGCAIFEAIRRAFPCERVRIADRGLREGILLQLMASDRMWSQAWP